MKVMIATLVGVTDRSMPNQSHGAVPPKTCGTKVRLPTSGCRYGAVCSPNESPMNTTWSIVAGTPVGAASIAAGTSDVAVSVEGAQPASHTRLVAAAVSAAKRAMRRCGLAGRVTQWNVPVHDTDGRLARFATEMTIDAAVLACPNCALALQLSPAGATCASGHSFDRGRGGYLNLFLGGRLCAATTPGDTPDALAARRRFLAGGYYAPIATALAQAVGVPEGPVLDVGCGEGYYLSQLDLTSLYGLDVAKSAVQMAARRLPDAQFVVGSAYRLPVLDGSVAAVLSVFAPHPFEEFQRVLHTGGRWVTVTPGPNHLREMRPVLSGESEHKSIERLARRAVAPPPAVAAQRVEFELQLSAEALHDLFYMTPIQWQAGASGSDSEAGRTVTVTVDVWVASSSAWEAS